MEMAGLELEFKINETKNETKNVSEDGVNIEIDKIIEKKMLFKIGGNEIVFGLVPPPPSPEKQIEK
jgi:hypothetical protein